MKSDSLKQSRFGQHWCKSWPSVSTLMVFCTLSGLLLALGLALAARPDGSIRIGELDPLTGRLAMHGRDIHQGIVYAVEEANSRGGIHGRPLELLTRDDQSLPDVAINQTQELLLREKVVSLVGGYVDSLVGPISEIAGKHKIPYVASASLQGALTKDRHNPYFFRVSRLDGLVTPFCRFITEVLRPRRAAVLYAATPGATEFATDVKTCLESAGVAVPVVDKFRPGTSDFSALLLKLRLEPVDILISGGFYPDHLVLVRQLREQRTPLKAYLGPWGVAYQGFIDELGGLSENVFGACAWNPGISLPGTEAESQAFVEGFQKRFGEPPNTTTMHGYCSARALLTAVERVLRRSQELTGDAIRDELAHLELTLPMERLQFDQRGDPMYYHQVITQIQHGQMVVVYPPERATGKAVYPSP